MKNAKFIICEKQPFATYTYPYQNPGACYDLRSFDLPKEDGIATFRKQFSCAKKVKQATVTATALGIFDMELNGIRIGKQTDDGMIYDELKPGWTDYRLHVFSYTYDITDMLSEHNDWVIRVAPGWFAGRINYGFYGIHSTGEKHFPRPAFCGEIEITYDDGTTELVASDETFDSTVCGPVLYTDIWDGEYYDATKKDAHLTAAYEKAKVYTLFKGEIIPHMGPAVCVRKQLTQHPVSATVYDGIADNGTAFGEIRTVKKTEGMGCEKIKLQRGQNLVLDMGQNTVGRPRIIWQAKKGTEITVYFGEFCNDSGDISRGNDHAKGSIYMKNYRSALSRITYIAGSDEEETYAPTFAFFGYRYLEIGASDDIEIFSVTGEVIGSDLTETGDIRTDNEEINRLLSNIRWGMRCNYLSVPTDCPQRDERLGWTGDTQIFAPAASYLADIDGFMRKWLMDMRDSQVGFDGDYSPIVPRLWRGKALGAGAWTDAGITVPYRLYLMYGDRELVKCHYDSMEKYMAHIRKNGLMGPYTQYGDWLSYEETDSRIISYCYHAYDAAIMAEFSRMLGKKDRETYYLGLRKDIIAEFTSLFIQDEDLTVKTQTAYLLSLRFDMVEGARRDRFIEKLKQKIIANDYTLSTGFVGTGILCQTLSMVGLDDLAYAVLLQTKDPSWLYSVRQGATTVWERWNSYTLEKGFGDDSMNSFNHYAYGAVAEWMFAYMAGIRPDPENPGFTHFILSPRPDTRDAEDSIKAIDGYYDSVHGEIYSSWLMYKGKFVYRFTVPKGTTATVEFPLLHGQTEVRLNRETKTASTLNGKIESGKLIFKIGEGKYQMQ